MSEPMFSLDELTSLVGLVNAVGRYQKILEVVGVVHPLKERIAFLELADRVSEEHGKLFKAEAEKKAKETEAK